LVTGRTGTGDAKPFLKKRFCTPKNFEKGMGIFGFIGMFELAINGYA